MTILESSIVVTILIFLSYYDIKNRIIPDKILTIFLGIGIIFKLTNFGITNLVNGVLGFIVGGAVLLILALISEEGGVGGGDIKLMAVLGFCVGVYRIISITIASLMGVAIVFILFSLNRKKIGIPFAPVILVSFVLTQFLRNLSI